MSITSQIKSYIAHHGGINFCLKTLILAYRFVTKEIIKCWRTKNLAKRLSISSIKTHWERRMWIRLLLCLLKSDGNGFVLPSVKSSSCQSHSNRHLNRIQPLVLSFSEEQEDRMSLRAVSAEIASWVIHAHFNFKLDPPSVPLSIIFSSPSSSATTHM